MSFHGYKEVIEEGDTVILYLSFNSMQALKVSKEKANKHGESIEYVHQTTYGALKVADLIGKKFGTKVRLSRGYAFVLYPTPQLWTKCLPHRTQILYATDISLIIQQLDLRPGSVVVESGTGSGSLSHSLIRTVAPNGHLYTFDFHQDRVDVATQEFKDHKVDKFVTAQRRDVCGEGFGDDLEGKADAVFLDLPHPWDAVPFAKKALRKDVGGRLCSFSPCVEQVQRAIVVMEAQGFKEITTMECLIREFQVRKISLPVFEPDRPVPPPPAATPHLAGTKRKAADDVLAQPDEAVDEKPDGTTTEKPDEKGAEKPEDTVEPEDNKSGGPGKTEEATTATPVNQEKSGDKETESANGDKEEHSVAKLTVKPIQKQQQQKPAETTFTTGVPLSTMPGHTGFLTFATLPASLTSNVSKST